MESRNETFSNECVLFFLKIVTTFVVTRHFHHIFTDDFPCFCVRERENVVSIFCSHRERYLVRLLRGLACSTLNVPCSEKMKMERKVSKRWQKLRKNLGGFNLISRMSFSKNFAGI